MRLNYNFHKKEYELCYIQRLIGDYVSSIHIAVFLSQFKQAVTHW